MFSQQYSYSIIVLKPVSRQVIEPRQEHTIDTLLNGQSDKAQHFHLSNCCIVRTSFRSHQGCFCSRWWLIKRSMPGQWPIVNYTFLFSKLSFTRQNCWVISWVLLVFLEVNIFLRIFFLRESIWLLLIPDIYFKIQMISMNFMKTLSLFLCINVTFTFKKNILLHCIINLISTDILLYLFPKF